MNKVPTSVKLWYYLLKSNNFIRTDKKTHWRNHLSFTLLLTDLDNKTYIDKQDTDRQEYIDKQILQEPLEKGIA